MRNSKDFDSKYLLLVMSKRDINQRQLALKANVAPEYLNKIIKGHKRLGMQIAQKLAKALDCSIEEITVGKIFEPSIFPGPTIDDAISILSLLKSASPQQIEFVRSYLSKDAVDAARDKLSSLHKKTDKP